MKSNNSIVGRGTTQRTAPSVGVVSGSPQSPPNPRRRSRGRHSHRTASPHDVAPSSSSNQSSASTTTTALWNLPSQSSEVEVENPSISRRLGDADTTVEEGGVFVVAERQSQVEVGPQQQRQQQQQEEEEKYNGRRRGIAAATGEDFNQSALCALVDRGPSVEQEEGAPQPRGTSHPIPHPIPQPELDAPPRSLSSLAAALPAVQDVSEVVPLAEYRAVLSERDACRRLLAAKEAENQVLQQRQREHKVLIQQLSASVSQLQAQAKQLESQRQQKKAAAANNSNKKAPLSCDRAVSPMGRSSSVLIDAAAQTAPSVFGERLRQLAAGIHCNNNNNNNNEMAKGNYISVGRSDGSTAFLLTRQEQKPPMTLGDRRTDDAPSTQQEKEEGDKDTLGRIAQWLTGAPLVSSVNKAENHSSYDSATAAPFSRIHDFSDSPYRHHHDRLSTGGATTTAQTDPYPGLYGGVSAAAAASIRSQAESSPITDRIHMLEKRLLALQAAEQSHFNPTAASMGGSHGLEGRGVDRLSADTAREIVLAFSEMEALLEQQRGELMLDCNGNSNTNVGGGRGGFAAAAGEQRMAWQPHNSQSTPRWMGSSRHAPIPMGRMDEGIEGGGGGMWRVTDTHHEEVSFRMRSLSPL